MIVTCPSCDIRFKVDTAALGAKGRKVRCSKCAHDWFQTPEGATDAMPAPAPEPEEAIDDDDLESEDALETASADVVDTLADDIEEDLIDVPGPIDLGDFEPEPMERNSGRSVGRKKKSKIGATLGWLTLLIILIGGPTGAILYKDKVIEIWPPSNRLYNLVGMGILPPGTGLELRNIKSERHREGDVQSLIIKGEVANTSRDVRDVPVFRGALTSKEGDDIHAWNFTIRQENLLPGESVPFETIVETPPKGATGLSITFLSLKEAGMMPGGKEMMEETAETEETEAGDMEQGADKAPAMEEEAPMMTDEEAEPMIVEEEVGITIPPPPSSPMPTEAMPTEAMPEAMPEATPVETPPAEAPGGAH